MRYVVEVACALSRPVKIDEYRLLVVDSDSDEDACLVAAQIAGTHCVMVLDTLLIEWEN